MSEHSVPRRRVFFASLLGFVLLGVPTFAVPKTPSGSSARPAARVGKIAPAEILVVHDELDLPPGQMKLKQGGGNGGHNGLKDIQAQLGAGDFWRLRLGIGHPGVKAEVVNYVLRKPSPEHRTAIENGITLALSALEPMLAGEMERAMMKVHARPPRPKPPPHFFASRPRTTLRHFLYGKLKGRMRPVRRWTPRRRTSSSRSPISRRSPRSRGT